MNQPYFPLLIAAIMLILISCSKDADLKVNATGNSPNPNSPTPAEVPTGFPLIVFGTKSHPCGENNCYCEGDKGICLIIDPSIANGTPLGTNEGIGEFIDQGNGTMRINILDEDNPSSSEVFTVLKDYSLKEVSEAFNGKEVIIKAGNYPIDYSQFPHGSVLVEIY